MSVDKVCFVIAPIGDENSDIRVHSDWLLKHIIEPAVEKCHYTAVRADRIPQPGIVTSQIITLLLDAPLVIADLSYRNPNVFYELGIRHGASKPTIHMARKEEKGLLPFDVSLSRTIFFDLRNPDDVVIQRQELVDQITTIEKDASSYDNPVTSVRFQREIGGALTERTKQLLRDIEGVFQAQLQGIEQMRDDVTPISLDDIQISFENMPALSHDKEGVRNNLVFLRMLLMNNGIYMRRQLKGLTESADMIDTLKKLYIDELERSRAAPLDPTAIASWGAALYTRVLTPDQVRRRLRLSEEYEQKHRPKS
jgi:hypothetical protein